LFNVWELLFDCKRESERSLPVAIPVDNDEVLCACGEAIGQVIEIH